MQKILSSEQTKNLLTALLVAVIAFVISYFCGRAYWLDLNSSICSARHLLQGLDPYSGCAWTYHGLPAAEYPLTTALMFVPFALLPGVYASAAIWAVFHFLLAYGILKAGQPRLFGVFLSGPYAWTLLCHQFSPMIGAALLLPGLLPLALVKPQMSLPLILTNLTKRRAAAMAAIVALSFIVYPTWPLAWWRTARNFDGVIPLLALPFGPLMLLALVYYKDLRLRRLFLFACIPQRSIYDLVPLLLMTPSRYFWAAIGLSWLPFLYLAWFGMESVSVNLLFIYLPVLAALWLDAREASQKHAAAVAAEPA